MDCHQCSMWRGWNWTCIHHAMATHSPKYASIAFGYGTCPVNLMHISTAVFRDLANQQSENQYCACSVLERSKHRYYSTRKFFVSTAVATIIIIYALIIDIVDYRGYKTHPNTLNWNLPSLQRVTRRCANKYGVSTAVL